MSITQERKQDVITDFKSVDAIVLDPSSGVDDFSDLTLAAVPGNSTLITWGTGDSILIQGVKPNQLDASDFEFGAVSLALSADVGGWQGGGHGPRAVGYDIAFHDALMIAIGNNSIV